MNRALAEKLAFNAHDPRATLLKLVLRASAVLGTLVYLPSVYFAVKLGLVGVAVVDTAGILTVFALLCLPRLAFRVRAAVACLVFYAIGVMLLMSVGAVSQIYLFGFSVLAVLLFDVRVGLAAAVLSSVTLLVVGALGHAAPEMMIPGGRRGMSEWVVICLNFTLVDTLLTLGVGVLLSAMNAALRREVASGVSLDRERKLLRTLIDTLPDVVFTKDTSGRFVTCNPATVALVGREREEEVRGKTVFELFARAIAEPYDVDDREVFAGRAVLDREERSEDRAGNTIWYLTTKVPLRGDDGQVVGLLGISRDITARRLAAIERTRLLTQLQVQIERMPLAYLLSDREFRYTRWNPAAEQMFGFSEAEVLGKHPFDVVVPAASRPYVQSIFDKIQAGNMDAHGESENCTKNGSAIICEWHNTPMFDETGAFAGLMSLAQDVTERRLLEGQLRQAQKMEAVGQLAGGVAHDFNNLLSVVLTYSGLLLTDLESDDPKRADVEEIYQAGQRAAELTRQLLMFSRKQVVEPKILDLNSVVASVEKMLRRLLGEDIELTTVPGVALGRIRADHGSIEQVIMNLAVNARDAMPVGGMLTLETANLTIDETYAKTHVGANPGEYVMLSVTDTGQGMTKATLARIFEPFFTTKEQGKGTGLGLSTVFGIVQQSGGSVWVYSEPGIGTTFKIYLPRIDAGVDEAPAVALKATLGGSETILLVEDETQVRDVARGILRRHGYTVLEAQNAGEALLICEQHDGPIQLLLTDVVMPKMSGPTLAKRLVQIRPEMKVVCMSGYTDDAAVRHGVIDAEFAYLQKPLTVDSLLRKVREVLDGAR
jgi:PAS domain S-box-containing protein